MCKLSPARRAGGSLLLVLALGACSNDDEPTVTPPTTAVGRFRPKVATRSQYPLLAVMVTYTAGGLFLLLQG